MSEKINLNTSEYDGSDINIFNGGSAGVVENVKVSIEKGEESKPVNYPDYHLVFKDADNGRIDKGFYYLDEQNENFKKRLVGMGSELRHVWGNLIGADTPIPEFSGHKQMVDQMMLKFKEATEASPDVLYRTVATYGTKARPQKYLRIPFFPPYFERMDVKESRVVLPRNSRMMPFVEDSKEASYDEVHDKPAETSGW